MLCWPYARIALQMTILLAHNPMVSVRALKGGCHWKNQLFRVRDRPPVVPLYVDARRIQRRRYHKTCGCPQVPGIVTAPPAPRVIPKSPLGVSLWTTVLLDKYLYGRPTYRFCEQLKHHGVPLSQGTLTDGLQKIAVLFEPMMTALYERQMSEKRF